LLSCKQAVEKGSPALLRSLQRIDKYACARRFLARLASEAFLNSLNLSFSKDVMSVSQIYDEG
jgi:hypothetical protein